MRTNVAYYSRTYEHDYRWIVRPDVHPSNLAFLVSMLDCYKSRDIQDDTAPILVGVIFGHEYFVGLIRLDREDSFGRPIRSLIGVFLPRELSRGVGAAIEVLINHGEPVGDGQRLQRLQRLLDEAANLRPRRKDLLAARDILADTKSLPHTTQGLTTLMAILATSKQLLEFVFGATNHANLEHDWDISVPIGGEIQLAPSLAMPRFAKPVAQLELSSDRNTIVDSPRPAEHRARIERWGQSVVAVIEGSGAVFVRVGSVSSSPTPDISFLCRELHWRLCLCGWQLITGSSEPVVGSLYQFSNAIDPGLIWKLEVQDIGRFWTQRAVFTLNHGQDSLDVGEIAASTDSMERPDIAFVAPSIQQAFEKVEARIEKLGFHRALRYGKHWWQLGYIRDSPVVGNIK